MDQKMAWKEIKKKYPNQWVSLDQIECDKNGKVKAGIVTAFGPDLGSVTEVAKKQKDTFTHHKFEYTGTIKPFLGVAKWSLSHAQVD